MNKAMFEWYGYNVKVEYEVTDDSIEISDWEFESDEIVDELNLYNDHAREVFEEELEQMIADYERNQTEAQKWIRPYKEAQRRRINNQKR